MPLSEGRKAENEVNIAKYSDFTSMWMIPLVKDAYVRGIFELIDPDCIIQYLNEVFASGDEENTGLFTVVELARLLHAEDCTFDG